VAIALAMNGTSTPSHGLIRKHWNGEYSFARSFWINLIFLSTMLPFIALVAQSLLRGRASDRIQSTSFLVVDTLSSILLLWGAVGTLRAGARYQNSGGLKVWFIPAIIAIAFLVYEDLAFQLYSQTALIENGRMMLTGRFGPPASISTINDGAAVLIEGELQDGTARDLSARLDASPGVTNVAFDSKGGLFKEARLIAQIIADRHLNTYVAKRCSSACTLAFLAGKTRCMSDYAKLGFHAGRRMGLPGEMRPTIANAQRSLYAKAGLPDSFIDDMMAVPSTSIWYPTHDELLDAHVLTPDCPAAAA
jgi:hypothetical protein